MPNERKFPPSSDMVHLEVKGSALKPFCLICNQYFGRDGGIRYLNELIVAWYEHADAVRADH